MRILMLANPDSVHTRKWVRGLAARGVEICLVGLQPAERIGYGDLRGVRVESAGVPSWMTRGSEWSGAKLFYLRAVSRVRALAREFAPDVVHAHYLTSYGLVGALAGVHPLLISVWGTDIFENPGRSRLHAALVRFALGRADGLSATSQVMAAQTRRFTDREVRTIPFGIDMAEYAPAPSAARAVVIGTVKTLHPTYAVDDLLRAFALVVARMPATPLQLRIVGDGPQRGELVALAAQLGIADRTEFVGSVPPAEVPREQNALDIFVALSHRESFGVAVIEAGACGRPVVVSDAGGLPEVVRDGITGFVVPRNDPSAAADALERLVRDPALRARMGAAGREHVARTYDFDDSLDQMLELYASLAKRPAGRVTR